MFLPVCLLDIDDNTTGYRHDHVLTFEQDLMAPGFNRRPDVARAVLNTGL